MIVLLLLSVLPRDTAIRESVDLIEVSHVFDGEGREHLTQIIFWGWRGSWYEVIAWRLVKSDNQLPIHDWSNGGYTALWQDGEVLRKVHAPAVRESWLQYDPELADREFCPAECRPGLKQVKGR